MGKPVVYWNMIVVSTERSAEGGNERTRTRCTSSAMDTRNSSTAAMSPA